MRRPSFLLTITCCVAALSALRPASALGTSASDSPATVDELEKQVREKDRLDRLEDRLKQQAATLRSWRNGKAAREYAKTKLAPLEDELSDMHSQEDALAVGGLSPDGSQGGVAGAPILTRVDIANKEDEVSLEARELKRKQARVAGLEARIKEEHAAQSELKDLQQKVRAWRTTEKEMSATASDSEKTDFTEKIAALTARMEAVFTEHAKAEKAFLQSEVVSAQRVSQDVRKLDAAAEENTKRSESVEKEDKFLREKIQDEQEADVNYLKHWAPKLGKKHHAMLSSMAGSK